ncbi:hypothetical protein TMatcc_003720 [Talaromyces marneffei ATCC 18224]
MNALKRHGNNCRDLIDKMAETMKYAQKRMGLDMLSWGYHLSPMTLCTRTKSTLGESRLLIFPQHHQRHPTQYLPTSNV